MNDDRLYYSRRAEAQRHFAERSEDPSTRRIHLELAALLAARAETR